MLEIVIDNRDGNVWDVSGIVSEVTLRTARIGRASTLDFTLLTGGFYEDSGFTFNPGDVVRVRDDGRGLFLGYIFTFDGGLDEEVRISAYDQLRYLLAHDTFAFTNKTATEIIRQIAGKFELRLGELADTQYKIPTMLEDNQSLLDIITKALTLTFHTAGWDYVFYDNFGALTLTEISQMKLDLAIGDVSLVYDYRRKRSIENSANQVKLVQDNEDTGRRDVYVYKDSENIAKWGLLQYYEVVDGQMNPAQIKERLEALTAIKNRVLDTFSVEAIGDSRVRAGSYVWIKIDAIGVNAYYMVDECTHRWEGDGDHTMLLTLKGVVSGELSGFD